jgi:hypothetical protein
MKIQYCSDLHLEFPENEKFIKANPIIAKGDTLVLAGDIIPLRLIDKIGWFLDDVSKKFNNVYWLPGNHEYYGEDIDDKGFIFNENIKKNVYLVNNVAIQRGEILLLFTTLWTHISTINEFPIVQSLNDFKMIKSGNKNLNVTTYNELHNLSLMFLQDTVKDYIDYSIAVFTHHVPTFMHYPKHYKGDILNEAFAVEMHDFIADSNIQYWVFGHHHCTIKPFKIGHTQMLTNQLGYVGNNEHNDFSTSKVFKL